MFAVICSPVYYKDIEQAVTSIEEQIIHKDIGTDVDINSEIEKLCRLSIKHLIIDITSVSEPNKLVHALMKYKIFNDKTQIIIIAPNCAPGNELIHMLVSQIHIYDIIAPAVDVENNNVITELLSCVERPSAYKKAVKWLVEDSIPTEPNTKSKVKVVEREVEKTVTVYKPLPLQRRVGLFSLTERAGSSFLTANLALALSQLKIDVSVVELPFQRPYLFDSIGLGNFIDEENPFVSYPHVIANNMKDVKRDNIAVYKNVSWILMDPRLNDVPVNGWTYENSMMLLDIARGSIVTLVDAGYSVPQENINELLNIIDTSLVVVDCIPSDIMANYNRFKYFMKLKESGKSIYFIFNKWNPGINKKHLINYMDVKPLAFVPYINPEQVYNCAYSATVPYEKKEVKDNLNQCFSVLLKNIIPSELLSFGADKIKKKGLKFLFERGKK